MGLIIEDETIKSRAYYFIDFELDGQLFGLVRGIENPDIALEILRGLEQKGIFPRLSRQICYNADRYGYLTKDPAHENLTIERLEEIIRKKESNPYFTKAHVKSNYRY